MKEQTERERRWRLILGKPEEAEQEESQQGQDEGDTSQMGEAEARGGALSEGDAALDEALNAVYGESDEGGLDDASPELLAWLDDIHGYFPSSVADIMQKDAFERVGFRKLLRSPELLEEIEPDINMVAKLLAMKKSLPAQAHEPARALVREVVEELKKQLEYPLEQAVKGAVQRALRGEKPRRLSEIHFRQTIQANLRHYQPEQKTIIPEKIVGYRRESRGLRDLILCIDQSGSMAESAVFASVCGAILASVPAVNTKLVTFSTTVVDLTDKIDDPVEMLFSMQLRGGTKIGRAMRYCQQEITRPHDTIFVLITDLMEGGSTDEMMQVAQEMKEANVTAVCLLALNEKGTPRFNRKNAQRFAQLNIPTFACPPQLFPDLVGGAILGRDLNQWASSNNIVTAPSN